MIGRAWHRIRSELFIRDDFDRLRGTETSRHVSKWRLGIGGSAVHYQATDPGAFAQACQLLPSDAKTYAFVDLGSGKGRVLIMAHEWGFQHIIGIELTEKLTGVCRWNLKKLGITNVSVFTESAVTATLPDSPVVVFMYNPFRPPVFNAVVERLKIHQYPLFLIYVNPEYRTVVEETGQFAAILDSPNLLVCKKTNPKASDLEQ